MFRFVAFVWNDADVVSRESAAEFARRLTDDAPQWQPAFEANGLRVFCADVLPGASEPYGMNGDGVVLGKLFRSAGRNGTDPASVPAPLQMSEGECYRILASGGRRLIESYWGRYVAFVHNEVARVTHVLRDPSGGLPCYTASFGGVHVYFSRVEDVPLPPGQRFTLNWRYAAAALCQTQLVVHATGLNEVTRVLGGECVEHRDGKVSRSFYWNLLDVARVAPIEDPVEAAVALRATTRDCTHAWASSYRSILHLLSGGLDSSIILACLKDAPVRPEMACVNYFSAGSNTDEREYARLAANDAQCRLIELERNSALSLEPLLRIRKTVVPHDYFFYLDEGRTEAALAREHGARALFNGYGGDQIFYRSRAAYAAGDFLRVRGMRPALFGVALDMARIDRVSVWNVLGQAIKAGWFGKRWSLADELSGGRQKRLVRDEVLDDINRDERLMHPWMRAAGNTPNGKLFHAHQLLFPMEFYNPLGTDDDPELVAPLYSQPVLELAMRLPTWQLLRGGWDRALARRAFRHDVPRQIVIRRTKGGQEEHAKAILLRNLGFARNLLVDGRLVQERLLDGKQVAEVLSSGPARLGSGNVELFACLSIEAWVRRWTTA